MPAGGLVTFDYVSGKRVPKDARAQRDEVFQSLKRELSNPALSEDHRLLMLRTSAITHYWNASQVRQLVALITYQRRVDAAIMLFRRCVDPVKYIGEDLHRGEVRAGAAPDPHPIRTSTPPRTPSAPSPHSFRTPSVPPLRRFRTPSARPLQGVYGMLKPAERKALRLRLGEAITKTLPEAERALDSELEILTSRGITKPKPPEPEPAAEGEGAEDPMAGVVFLTEEGAEGEVAQSTGAQGAAAEGVAAEGAAAGGAAAGEESLAAEVAAEEGAAAADGAAAEGAAAEGAATEGAATEGAAAEGATVESAAAEGAAAEGAATEGAAVEEAAAEGAAEGAEGEVAPGNPAPLS